MPPSSHAKRKRTPLKLLVPLKTWPVMGTGLFGSLLGMDTTRPCLTPEPLYSVLTPLPLSDTQNGPPGANDMPQGFLSWGSGGCSAGTAPSDTRLMTV